MSIIEGYSDRHDRFCEGQAQKSEFYGKKKKGTHGN